MEIAVVWPLFPRCSSACDRSVLNGAKSDKYASTATVDLVADADRTTGDKMMAGMSNATGSPDDATTSARPTGHHKFRKEACLKVSNHVGIWLHRLGQLQPTKARQTAVCGCLHKRV